jgi:hypothetical protein
VLDPALLRRPVRPPGGGAELDVVGREQILKVRPRGRWRGYQLEDHARGTPGFSVPT